MEKDEEKVDVAINVVRYQIMPSLVALQTMRNRLHLAFLGKKLMKWTALATGKELRRLSQELAVLLQDYGTRFRQAFIMLARCRFHEPNLNVIILECVPATAMLSTKMTARSIAGVKAISLGVIESGKDGYSLLGLGKGGELIKETKQAWYELLKIMVLICQFRVTFMLVDAAHKAATKKQNVLQRLIIPKIDLTMRYILSELEEQEREETFRLKRFKQLKYKYEVKTIVKEEVEEEEEEEEVVEEEEVAMIEEPEPEPEPPEPTEEELIMKHIYEVIRLAEIIQNAALIPQEFGLTRCDLGKLRVQLNETVKLSQTSKDGRDCVKCKASSCNCPASANPAKPPCNEDLEVVRPPGYEAALKLLPKTKVETPVPDYIMRPRGRKPYRAGVKIDAVERLNDLQDHVDQVICLTHCYKQDGVLSKSAENFLKCLKNVKTKIDEIKDNRTVNAKINRLKWEVEHLEHVTDIVQKEGLSSDSISSFLSCCKEFKTKLECRQSSKGAPSVCSIEKLLERINVSIELSKEAKMGGLVSESVEEFIQTCKEIKAKIDSKEEDETTKPKVINDLRFNLHDIMKSISKYKQDGLLSDSIENFYTTCESTKAKLDSYKLPPGIKLDESQMTTLKQESRHSIIPKHETCPICQGTDENALKSTSKTNKVSIKEETKHSPVPVKSTSVPIFSRHGSQDKSYCPKCNKCCKCAKLQESAPEEHAEPEAPVDSSCGCGNADENKRCKAKFYEDCPKCMKEPLIPSCKTTSTSSKSSEVVDNKDNTKKTCKACSRIYTALMHAKPGSYHSCKSNSSQPYVPKLNKPASSQITAQQPSNHTRESFQCIALDKAKSKECDDNKDQEGGLNNNTVSMMILTKFKNRDGSSVEDSNSVVMKPGSCESVKITKRVRNAPTTKGCIQIVRNIKSETLIRTQDLSDSYPPCIWSHTSAETLTSQDKNNESDSAQIDPFFCCNSSTSHNSGPVLPL